MPYSPLAGGFHAGTHTRSGESLSTRARESRAGALYGRPADFDVIERVLDVARERDEPPARVALAWLLAKPGVTAPIVGATKPGHVDDAVAAASITLSRGEIDRLEEPYRPRAFRA